jgi:hypothetical protein
MAQKAEHHYGSDYHDTYGRSSDQNKWIWGGLAALAALALIVWFASAGGPTVSPSTTSSTTTTEQAPAPAQPEAPVLEPAPAAPATGSNTQQ